MVYVINAERTILRFHIPIVLYANEGGWVHQNQLS